MPANQFICKKGKEKYMFECVKEGKVNITQMGKRGVISNNTITTEKAIKLWGDLRYKGFQHIIE